MVRETPPISPGSPEPTSAPRRPVPVAVPVVPAPRPVLPPQQLELYTVEIVKLMPTKGGADSAHTGEGRDGMKYNIKTVTKTPAVPGAEWFCHHLAEYVGVAAARPTIVSVAGELVPAYGSRWETGMLDQARNNDVLTGKLPGERLAARFSALYALDLFVHNVDRHHGNYAFVQIDGTYRLVAMDFSRAWTYHGWPLPPPPMPPNQSTISQGRVVRQHHPFDLPEAVYVLDRIAAVSIDRVQEIFKQMPRDWLDGGSRAAIARWWTDGSLSQRVDTLKRGLTDGTYL